MAEDEIRLGDRRLMATVEDDEPWKRLSFANCPRGYLWPALKFSWRHETTGYAIARMPDPALPSKMRLGRRIEMEARRRINTRASPLEREVDRMRCGEIAEKMAPETGEASDRAALSRRDEKIKPIVIRDCAMLHAVKVGRPLDIEIGSIHIAAVWWN